MKSVITGVYAARKIGSFPGNGTATGIFKQPVCGQVRINSEGVVGDHQADRRVHGGAEKAVHHYAATNYLKIAARFPDAATMFVPGSIGENLSSSGIDERTVAIGDVFSLGSTRLQVCQPRSPCWKIDARYGSAGVGKFVSDFCYQGWYYRVIEEGETGIGDELVLLDRNSDLVVVADFWLGWRERPSVADKLSRFLATPGLASVWQRYLTDRLTYLRAHPSDEAPLVPAVHPKRE
jgi:MOSC domain-containing protein YiiM